MRYGCGMPTTTSLIQLRVPPELHARLREQARLEERSMSTIVRQAIEDRLAAGWPPDHAAAGSSR